MMLPPNFTSYQPTEEEIKAGCKLSPVLPEPVLGADPDTPLGGSEKDLVREENIRVAVLAIPVENYGAAAFGRPAMPKVAEIKAATGYADVTVDEIIAAIPVAAEGE